ncbi:MAG TPA: hypothetical protein PLX39_07390 [Pyrinomonadaceae bacterium]|nr:hypothetical protein [Pyrinomonadaceae bacterium]
MISEVVGQNPERCIAIDQFTVLINKKRSIGISVKCDTDIGTGFRDMLPKVINVKGATIAIDIPAVRRNVERGNLGAKSSKKGGREPGSGPIRTINDDLLPAEVKF